jgi:hypothetical protein
VADDAAVKDDGPRIHVPGSELGQDEGDEDRDGVPIKKRTRRGSRGGRNRKKKPAGENGTEDGALEGEQGEPVAADGSEPAPPEEQLSTNGDSEPAPTIVAAEDDR